ncbi:MAG TPA: fatty acid desaturase [Gammaproteobacteria bacterium]|nr:fatty acid desaturase [Gammaproteobacteria bacterium]
MAAITTTDRYTKASYWRAAGQFGHTVLLLAVAVSLAFESLSFHYGLTIALTIVASVAYLRLFMIGHDCAHGSYLPYRWQNDLLGNVIGILTNTPLKYWARQHAKHHQTTGNLDKRGEGDVITMTVEEYQNASALERFRYRTYRNPWFLFLVAAPVHFLILHRLPLGQQFYTREGWISVMGTNIGIALYYGALIAAFGLVPFLMVYGPIVFLSSMGAVWLFYVQHQFEDAYWVRQDGWSYHEAALNSSSFYDLPRWLHFVTGNIGYHHIHHQYPRIPNYWLPASFNENSEFQEARRLGLWESLGTAWLALWDEDAQRMISFADYDKACLPG